MIGRALGDFILGEKLGEGGFGVVHHAEQPALGRPAVIKLLQAEHKGAADMRERFLREAKLASRLDHPYAAHIYAFGAEDDGTLWIAMELVRGTSLAELLKMNGPIAIDRLVPLVERICEVVQNAHEQGIVHRDIKPANIMVLSRAGRLLPKLLDFGIAKLVASAEPDVEGPPATTPKVAALTQRGAKIGSPLYMPPEQWKKDGVVDAKSDQYALAILVYECLTGRPPHAGDDVFAVARLHIHAPMPKLGEGFKPALDTVLARAAAKAQADRFPSVLEFAAALRAAAGLSHEPETLPRLAPLLARNLAELPQPIAEAAAALESAQNAHQARAALRETVATAARWLAVLALASRSRAGSADPRVSSDPPVILDTLRTLRRRDLATSEWIELAAALVAPFAQRPLIHPIPELVTLLASRETTAAWASFLDQQSTEELADSERARDMLGRSLPEASALLGPLGFLADYPLVVSDGGKRTAELWMGPRRTRRKLTSVAGDLPTKRPALIDLDARPVLLLDPLVQVTPAMPGAEEDLFLLAGHGRRGARLRASPLGHEIDDEEVWEWLREHVLAAVDGDAPTPETEAPYRGLAAFTASEAACFFGRERQVDAFLNRMRLQSLLVVAGPSGAGKSSFVQAGVLPALPPETRSVVLRPGLTPLETLAARTAEPADVVVVDQFEEIFTMSSDAAVREEFAARLLALPGKVILTLRDDFLARAEQIAALRQRIVSGLELVTTPARGDLERILVEPARLAGYEFEDPALVREMVDGVADRAGALPLLSFTAARLWELRDRHFHKLTRRSYEALGGVGGALAGHAEDTLARLPPGEQRLVREAFRRLVTAEGTRAIVGRDELRQLLGGDDSVVETLVAARLVVVTDDERVEIAHEALVEAWPRLREWRQQDAEGARLRHQLREAARQWDERRRPTGLLWRGDALAELELWRSRHGERLTEAEDAFAGASRAEANRGRRARRRAWGGVIVGLSLAVGALAYFGQQARESARQARLRLLDSYQEQGRRLLGADDPARALAYFDAALAEGADNLPLRYLVARALEQKRAQRLVMRHEAAVEFGGITPNGVLTMTQDGRVTLWDPSTGRERARVQAHRAMHRARLSPDGDLLATSADGEIKVWRTDTLALVGSLAVPDVASIVFDPTGRRLAAGSLDGKVSIWDLEGTPRTLATDVRIYVVRFSGDGRHMMAGGAGGRAVILATEPLAVVATIEHGADITCATWAGERVLTCGGGSGQTELWAIDGRRVATVSHLRPITTVAANQSATRAVTTDTDGEVREWDLADGRLLNVFVGHGAQVTQSAYCRDDRIVTASFDGTVRAWNGTNGKPVAVFAHPQGTVQWVACALDGKRALSAGYDRTARIWDLDRAPPARVLPTGSTEGVNFIGIRTDGARIVTAGMDGRARLWTRAGKLERVLEVGPPVGVALFDADGRRVLTMTPESVRLWDAATGSPLTELARGATITFADLSPRGDRVVTAHSDGTGAVWDLETGRRVADLRGHEGYMRSAVFSPDGRRLVTAGDDGTASVRDSTTGSSLLTLRGHGFVVTGAVFDRSGTRVLTSSFDRTARIWDAASGDELLRLEGQTRALSSAVFHPRSAGLVAGMGGDIRIWSVDGGRELSRFTGHSGPVSHASFTPDGQVLVSAGQMEERVLFWRVGLDERSIPEIRTEIACRRSFQLDGENLVLRPETAAACDEPRQAE